jgi:hypothetical protein
MKNVITMVAFNLGINQDKLKSKEKCMYVCMYVWSWIIFYQQWKHTRVPKKSHKYCFFCISIFCQDVYTKCDENIVSYGYIWKP